VLLVVVLPLSAFAQRTGGSFGGRSWGSGRSSSIVVLVVAARRRAPRGGSSRSSGTSYGTTYGGGSYGSYLRRRRRRVQRERRRGRLGVLGCVLAFFVILFLLGAVLGKKKNVGNITYAPPPMDENDTFSLGALAIAFDSAARAQVQGELDRLSQSLQMQDSPEALNAAAAQMAQCLARFLDNAYMTHHSLSEGVSMQVAQQQFDQAVNAERGRYLVETVRNDAGGVRKVAAPASRARAEEGGGFVVVTVLVARRGRFPGWRPPADRATLQGDLQILLAGGGGDPGARGRVAAERPQRRDVVRGDGGEVPHAASHRAGRARGPARLRVLQDGVRRRAAAVPQLRRALAVARGLRCRGFAFSGPLRVHLAAWRSTDTSPSRATWAPASRAS
jgi:uncharacterized membrane protein